MPRRKTTKPSRKAPQNFVGIWGNPYVNLEPYLDTALFPAIDDEICFSLSQAPVRYTGGSHRWMGIVPPSHQEAAGIDYGEVISKFSEAEFKRFVALSDDPEAFDARRRLTYRFGEEQSIPLTFEQMLFLKYRYGVYFPWKVFYEIIGTDYWDQKSSGAGKKFSAESQRLFPLTLAFIRTLPFQEIGRCILLGLEGGDHGTVHNDRDPLKHPEPDHFISFAPRGNKRLFLWNEAKKEKLSINSSAFWFNDCDYHGVDPSPTFQYSIRVDGVFKPEFLEQLERDHHRKTKKAV
jgi:hypothetical protein